VVEQPGARNERRASSRPPTDHGYATDIGYRGLDDARCSTSEHAAVKPGGPLVKLR
jgi:hypothetical protein